MLWMWLGCGSGRWHGVGAAWHVGNSVGRPVGVESVVMGWSRASVAGIGMSRMVWVDRLAVEVVVIFPWSSLVLRCVGWSGETLSGGYPRASVFPVPEGGPGVLVDVGKVGKGDVGWSFSVRVVRAIMAFSEPSMCAKCGR